MADTKQLSLQLKTTLATVFAFYLKAHNFHWNVTGPLFSQYHEFFGDIYQAVWESTDAYAEHIRALDDFTPGSFEQFSPLSKVQGATTVMPIALMLEQLYNDNEVVLQELYKAHNYADMAGKYGIVNFIEGQIDYHDKLHWMLKASMKASM